MFVVGMLSIIVITGFILMKNKRLFSFKLQTMWKQMLFIFYHKLRGIGKHIPYEGSREACVLSFFEITVLTIANESAVSTKTTSVVCVVCATCTTLRSHSQYKSYKLKSSAVAWSVAIRSKYH
jgi:hypothetical protein